MEARRFLIMAGGTGGHVFPALTTARLLQDKGHEVNWLGSRGGMEVDWISATDIPLRLIRVSGLRGKGGLARFLAPLRLSRALFEAWRTLRQVQPDCVLGMGGFVSGPGGFAAWLTGRPLVIHEQNAVAGMTNRWLSRFALITLEAFPGSFGPGTVTRCTGNPVRRDLVETPEPRERIAIQGRLRILVLGGSRGARAINELLAVAVAAMPAPDRPSVMHQCGRDHLEATQDAYHRAGVEAEVVPFIEDMASAYSRADLVICRAGALTLAEICAVGLGSILVPFPHAVDDHQTVNARYLSDNGAARLIPQTELDAAGLAAQILALDADRETLVSMAECARSLRVSDATERVVNYCMEAAHG